METPTPPSMPEPKTETVIEEKPVQNTEDVVTSYSNETASPEYKEEITSNTITPSEPINQKNEVPPEHVKTNDPGISHVGIFGLLTSLSTVLGMLIPRKKNK